VLELEGISSTFFIKNDSTICEDSFEFDSDFTRNNSSHHPLLLIDN